MSTMPILLFLHGVGTGDPEDEWQEVLSKSLENAGYPSLDDVSVIAPKYPNTLVGTDDNEPLPKLTAKELRGDAARRSRQDFERRTGAIEMMLGRHDPGAGWAGADAIVSAATRREAFRQANNYINDSKIRAQVLNRVLRQLPRHGRVVIVGHSLGSVIAADLIRRLPTGLQVFGMVTLGSPLAHPRFDVDNLRRTLSDPPTNLAWWVNFWNSADPVTTHKGVSSIFPWMIDYRVQTPLGLDVHDAVTYLGSSVAATAIGFALFGSSSREVVVVEKGLDIPLDYAETVALAALRYAHLMKNRLRGDKHVRFSGALRQVQAATVDLVRQRNAAAGRPMPAAIAQLSVDLTDPDSIAPEPSIARFSSKHDAVIPLLSIAASNVLRPFEIEIPDEIRREAMEELTLEMGLGSQIGTDVFRASDRARDALKDTNWFKWFALGLGAAAVVAATGGLALAAAPGVAGAAAITSALAAFGPGGMIGGLLTAGTLVSAGGGSIAIGLANPATSAAALSAVVASQVAVAILRRLQGLEQDPANWNGLVEIGMELRRERARLEAFADKSAPTLKELHLKPDAVDNALRYLHEHDLGPKD